MSPISAGGGTNTKTGGEHISRLVETPRGSFAYGKTGTLVDDVSSEGGMPV